MSNSAGVCRSRCYLWHLRRDRADATEVEIRSRRTGPRADRPSLSGYLMPPGIALPAVEITAPRRTRIRRQGLRRRSRPGSMLTIASDVSGQQRRSPTRPSTRRLIGDQHDFPPARAPFGSGVRACRTRHQYGRLDRYPETALGGKRCRLNESVPTVRLAHEYRNAQLWCPETVNDVRVGLRAIASLHSLPAE